MFKFKVGDVAVRTCTQIKYKILEVNDIEYMIELPSGGKPHYILKEYVDKDCRLLTKLEKAMK